MTYTVSSGTLNSSIPYHTSSRNDVCLWCWLLVCVW